jgi:hypothetical protein
VGALCKRSVGKTRKMIIAHAKSAALDWLSLLALLAVTLSVYRLPLLSGELRTARCWASVQLRTTRQIHEMCLDTVLGIQTLVLTLTLYQALEHWLDLSDALLTPRPDFPLARQRGHARMAALLRDVCELLAILPRAWDACTHPLRPERCATDALNALP